MTQHKSSLLQQLTASPLQALTHPLLTANNITLSIKRDDLLDPEISGNKWRKLKYNLIHARENKIQHLISFGGAFSNHIHALAAASHRYNFNATGFIRGEEHYATNPTLSEAKRWGMQLQFVDRKTYRLRDQADYLKNLQSQYENAYIIPEGGSNELAIPGVEEVMEELIQQTNQPIDYLFTATGSAGTLAGLISGVLKFNTATKVHGVAVLKGASYLEDNIRKWVTDANKVSWHLHTNFHEGGYAKTSSNLADFCKQFTVQTKVPIEPIYTGKMFYAVWQLIEQGYFPPGTHIVLLHTGGLQGLSGLKQQHKF